MLEIVGEILKFTLPALIVFLTSYYLLRQYLNSQFNMKALEARSDIQKDIIPLKLKSYERLLLFLERISLTNLVMRLRTKNLSARDLQASLLIAVQKEYEHNLAQQLYTSSNLWKIIALAKDEVLNVVTTIGSQHLNDPRSEDFSNQLLNFERTWKDSPLEMAKHAVKEEAKMILQI